MTVTPLLLSALAAYDCALTLRKQDAVSRAVAPKRARTRWGSCENYNLRGSSRRLKSINAKLLELAGGAS